MRNAVRTREPVAASHEAFVDALRKQLALEDPDGTRLAQADPAQAAQLALAPLLDSSVQWVEQLGAFYDTDGVRNLLGAGGSSITRQAVHKRKGLLALTTGSGRVVYPAFQFQGRQLTPGLDEVLSLLNERLVSRWTLASWLVSPDASLEGEKPIEVLQENTAEGRAAVLAAARSWATAIAA